MKRFLERLDAEVQDFNSKESRENGKDIQYIQKTLGYPETDIKECEIVSSFAKRVMMSLKRADVATRCTGLKITDYPENIGEVKRSVIFDTLNILEKSGVVQAPSDGWKLEMFVDSDIAKVV